MYIQPRVTGLSRKPPALSHVSVSAPHDRVRQGLGKQIHASDNTNNLIVVVDDTEEAKAEGPE